MAACPFCAEEIAAGAERCPTCGERLKPEHEVPDADRGVWQKDALVVPLLRAHVRARGCVVCGTSERSVQPRQRYYRHRSPVGLGWTPVTAYLPLCDGCFLRWRVGQSVVIVVALSGCLGIPLLGAAVHDVLSGVGLGRETAVPVLALALAWGLATLAVRFVVRRRLQVRCVRVEGREVSLAFPDREVARRVIHAVQGQSSVSVTSPVAPGAVHTSTAFVAGS